MKAKNIIEQQLKELGLNFIERLGKAAALSTVLQENEDIKAQVTGFYGKTGGCLVATDKRLLFLQQGVSKRVEQFNYDKITSFEYREGPLTDGIVMTSFGEQRKIEKVPRHKARPFCEVVNSLIN